MILDYPRYSERIGSLNINSIQKVYELDGGQDDEPYSRYKTVKKFSHRELAEIFNKMAIIIPIKSEKIRLLEGVLSGIPHDCLTIIVSNSSRYPIDRFRAECNVVKQFVQFTHRNVIIIHQKDQNLTNTLRYMNYTSIFEGENIRDGKAEGMIIGMILARMFNKEYVGFIDADNYIPGAVNEYVNSFAAGILMSRSPYCMVRISWIFKPKIKRDKLYFAKWGRISECTNKYLNAMLSNYTDFETDIIKTGNSGEHAMSMKLAEMLTYSSGFSIETFEIVNMIERFGGLLPEYTIIDEDVELMQIETRNPHFHESKSKEHLNEMLLNSLSSIYYSKLSTPEIRKQIIKELKTRRIKHTYLNEPIYITPIKWIDNDEFRSIFMENMQNNIEGSIYT